MQNGNVYTPAVAEDRKLFLKSTSEDLVNRVIVSFRVCLQTKCRPSAAVNA